LTGGDPAGKRGPDEDSIPLHTGKPFILPSPSLPLLSHGT
jgi:hypothetical protein